MWIKKDFFYGRFCWFSIFFFPLKEIYLTRKPRFDKKLKFGKCFVYLTRFPMEYCVSKRDKNIFMYLFKIENIGKHKNIFLSSPLLFELMKCHEGTAKCSLSPSLELKEEQEEERGWIFGASIPSIPD